MPKRILVVEDEDKLRRVVQLHLEAVGFEVDNAATAELALPRTAAADLILTEFKLPGV
jgi:DNA-binding response OmpR family regulator